MMARSSILFILILSLVSSTFCFYLPQTRDLAARSYYSLSPRNAGISRKQDWRTNKYNSFQQLSQQHDELEAGYHQFLTRDIEDLLEPIYYSLVRRTKTERKAKQAAAKAEKAAKTAPPPAPKSPTTPKASTSQDHLSPKPEAGTKSSSQQSASKPAKKEKPVKQGPLTAKEKQKKEKLGYKRREQRQKQRDANAKVITDEIGGKKDDYAKPTTQGGGRGKDQAGKTRLDRAEDSKNNNKRLKPATGPVDDHRWQRGHEDWLRLHSGLTPAQQQKAKLDAERVNAQSMSDPNNPVTKGAGPHAANSVIRSSAHDSPSAPAGSNEGKVVTVVQKRPGDKAGSVRHLPVRYDEHGNAHYAGGRTNERTPYNNNGGVDEVPPLPEHSGSSAGTVQATPP